MQAKFDIGDFILLDNGTIRQIDVIIVDYKKIEYFFKGHNSIIEESKLTPEYILEVENFLKTAQATLEIMKQKLNQK